MLRRGAHSWVRFGQPILVVVLLAATCEVACGFTGSVASIPDGDTVELYQQGERFRTTIDLYGIDCPEIQQHFGYSAKDETAKLVGLKTVAVEVFGKDSSGRLSAVIAVEGKNVNEVLLSEGWAWVSPECTQPFCDDWQRLQAGARSRRIGLWAAPQPLPPWEWRRQGKRELFYLSPDKKTPIWRSSP